MERFVDVHTRAVFATEKMKKNNIFTTDNLFCDVYCFEPGQEQAGHKHGDADKIYYVIEGAAAIQIGAEEHIVGAGSAVLAPKGESHQVRNTGSVRVKLLVFMAPKPA